ncbi:hypothetical protein EYZ11_005157 [Aspergillus tanneri]|uniref:TauD/TfdA-like domain-containing protein n=1 Tax=Aspergillus tanneri TaxID=1220188 RepID=A0A4S3JIS7_9EURO|nr:uncharacterized protein ATNIH1004_007194 [Aspergillus tanneri]KAA8645775.1 hypothetical protein ATNIH1004_007194 [Aspergillus tanneri]THC95343.1 hypothetical protein EYZ11_005157 [Aspergillus tanneri]
MPLQIPTPTFTLESFDLPSSNQRLLGPPHPPETVTPLALRPSDPTPPTLDDIITGIQALQHDHLLTQSLSRHGALLFRNLPIHDAHSFSKFAHAFGYPPHEIIGIVVDRPLLAPNVAPANESPPEVLIYNHNESPQVPHAPEYVFFYCHRAPSPDAGGESPISSSLELFQRAQLEIPDFITSLAQKGILSRVTYTYTPQYKGGATLLQSFGKHIHPEDDDAVRRRKIEAQIARYNRGKHTTYEWTEDGIVLTHRLPVIRTQVGTNLPALFTGLAAYYRGAKVNGARKNVARQMYGDGTEIPERYLETLARITDEIRVLHRWQEGDVLVFDNVVAQHGREPWRGSQKDRIVMASLFDGDVPGGYGFGDWAKVVPALEDREI